MNSYLKLRHKTVIRNTFIFGAGPSLYYNWRYPFFNQLHKHGLVYTVNSAMLGSSAYHYWVSTDSLCRKWSWWPMVTNSSAVKVVRDSWLKYKKELKGFLYFKARPTSEDVINPDDEGLSYCSSLAACIDLSIQMGNDKIFIFGLDHCSYQGKNHFWQFFIEHYIPTSEPGAQWNWKCQQDAFSIHLKAYEALKGYGESRGVKIYNVNYFQNGEWMTKVDTFEKITLPDVRKMIISYNEVNYHI
jgi:hypothetical protein